MDAEILHSGFDGLKFTLQSDISPELRIKLAAAKDHARKTHSDCLLEFGNIILNVTNKGARGFPATLATMALFGCSKTQKTAYQTIVDFRAFGLATGGLDGAEQHFRNCMNAFGIEYVETQLRVALADFAVDFLALWFEPSREALVVPPGTKITEYTGVDETVTISSGARVVGLRAIANRQLAIYDKRAEVIQTHKMGWVSIWNAALKAKGKPPIDLSNRATSQVWRFEMHLGSKQLRNRFEMRNWQDIRNTIGDAFGDAIDRIRYCIPTSDRNRARWPTHELWRKFESVIGTELLQNCAGVLPSDVIHANRMAKMRELDAQLSGLFITRAAVSGVSADDFEKFMEGHVEALIRLVSEHPITAEERIAKAGTRYRWT